MPHWTEQLEYKASLIADQMRTAAKLVGRFGTPEDNPVEPYVAMLRKLYEELPAARVLDSADIVLRAEGPGATHDLPWLGALNWVTVTAEKSIRSLSAMSLDLLGAQGNSLARKLDLRLSGVAQGSLMIGVKLMPPGADLLPADFDLIDSVAKQLGRLPEITRFIDDEGLRPGIEEATPDPALRDVQLSTLLRFSPTGRKGIHTLEISSNSCGVASLSQRERVVLREVTAHPDMRQSKQGEFIGEVREADLDKTRLHLRGVKDIGTLRCVLPTLTDSHVRAIFGKQVRVKGRYQCDRNGRPRLLVVESIEPINTQMPLV